VSGFLGRRSAKREGGSRTKAIVVALAIIAVSCNGARDASPDSGAAGISATGPATGGIAVTLASDPNPPKSGENSFAVTVKQADGSPITDGTVKAVFSMPAMPSMNMPAMKSDATLAHEGGGAYRGPGQLSMAGTWDVTVSVSRNGQEVGNQRFSLVAK
jgi:hypothetical protein